MEIGKVFKRYSDGEPYLFGAVKIVDETIFVKRLGYVYATFKTEKSFKNWMKANGCTFESAF